MPQMKINRSSPQAKSRHEMLSIQATPDLSGIRTAELIDTEYTVIPCVALVEGVLWPANAPHPELALAEEFGRFPDGWNGRPVVMNHPVVNGSPVSASSPGVLENYMVGQIFNTKLEDNKLKTEIWINKARVEELGGEHKATYDRLVEGTEVVEVSTGLFSMQEIVTGTYNGEEYQAIWRNIVPDHLALLSEGTIGACSVADGCGAPRTNNMTPSMKAVLLNGDTDLNADAPTIHQHSCECGGTCDDCKEIAANNAVAEQSMFKRFMNWMRQENGDPNLTTNSEGLSDGDLRTALITALENRENRFCFIFAVFHNSNAAGSFVYEIGFDGPLFEESFSIDASGVITLGGTKQAVRPQTQFVPMEVDGGTGDASTQPTDNGRNARRNEKAMKTEQMVRSLIDNEATKWTEDDETFLKGLEEGQLEKMLPEEAAPAEEVKEEEATTVVDNAAAQPVTAEEYLKDAPEEVRSVLQQGLTMQRERRAYLVSQLKENKRNKFSEEDLKAMSLSQLENMAALADVDLSYEGAGITSNSVRDDESDPGYTEAPDLLAAIGKPRNDNSQAA